MNQVAAQILCFHKGGREDRRALVASGQAPRDFFYGFLAAEADGNSIDWLSTAEPYRGRWGYFQRWLERAHSALTGVAWRPHYFRTVKSQMAAARLAVSVTDHFSLSLGRWAFRIRQRPFLVGLFHGLSDIENRAPARARPYVRWYIRRAAKGLDRLGFFGAADRAVSIARYGLDPARTFVFGFGVDTDFWKPAPTTVEDVVLAVGSDLNRDYDTLIAATLGRRLRLVTRLPIFIPPGRDDIELLRGSFDRVAISDPVLRDLYRRALCVAVIMHDCYQPSGYSVTLQAMACGVPVVLTNIKGLWAPEILRDGENCLLVPPGDADAVGAAVSRIAADPELRARLAHAGRQTAEQYFSLAAGEAAARNIMNMPPNLSPQSGSAN